MDGLSINISNALSFNKAENLACIEAETKRAWQTLLQGNGAGNDFLGWVNLPNNIDNNDIERIKEQAKRLRSISDVVVVVGIGGSYLGARMVIEALATELSSLLPSDNPHIVYAGHTLGEDYYADLLHLLDQRDYSVIVISKSGTTTEPAVAFRILKNHLENKYGHSGAKERIVAITDSQRGALHDMAQQEGYPMFVIPDNVGGRFSVLTPVGLLPIAVAGYDIEKLISGAREMQKICTSNGTTSNNPALMYAAIRNLLYRNGIAVEMMVGELPNTRYIAEWWKQLYGESEGKEHNGLLPHSITITTDLHSMGQYVQEGQRIMFETFLHVAKANHSVAIPLSEKDLDNVNYLTTKTLTDINHCAAMGTMEAHREGGVPIVEITIDSLNEENLGRLIYFFEFACGVSGYMLGVNPFDQPGVEAYKRNMFRLLGKPSNK